MGSASNTSATHHQDHRIRTKTRPCGPARPDQHPPRSPAEARSWDGADAPERGHCPAAAAGRCLVANPVNDALWGSNLVEVTKISPGPPGVGSRFRSKVRFAGREFELVREITEYEPNRRPAVKTISGPYGSAASGPCSRSPGGTRVTLTGPAWLATLLQPTKALTWRRPPEPTPGRLARAPRLQIMTGPAAMANRHYHLRTGPEAGRGGPQPAAVGDGHGRVIRWRSPGQPDRAARHSSAAAVRCSCSTPTCAKACHRH
jgi:hypothetical protein